MKPVRIVLLVLILLLGGLWFFSFSPKQSSPASTAETKRTITDSSGRTVEIPVHPQRVVALNPSNIDLYMAAGGTLVGRPNTIGSLPSDLRQKIESLPSVGETPSPNLEQILALKPDLVLGVDVGFHHSLPPQLEKADIPILLQSLSTYQQVLDTLRFYGELTGKPDVANAAATRIEKQVNQVKNRIAGHLPARVLIIWGSPESFNMALPSSFSGSLLTLLGAENIAAGQTGAGKPMPYIPLSLEFVAKSNPDVILFITHGAETQVTEKIDRDLAGQEAWQGLHAVQTGRVYKLPYHLFAVNPGTQVGTAVEKMAQLLYPEAPSP